MKWFRSREDKDMDLIMVGMIAEQVKVKCGLSSSQINNQIKFAYNLGSGRAQFIVDWLRTIKVYDMSATPSQSAKIKFEDVFDESYREEINKANLAATELIEKLKGLKETIK